MEKLKNTYLNFFLLSFGVLLFIACKNKNYKLSDKVKKLENLTVYSDNQQPESTVSFIREQTFGDTKEVLLNHIIDVGIDSLGRIFVAGRNKVHVYNGKGVFLTDLGKKGKGPGEFESIGGIGITSHKLLIYDALSQSMSYFSLDSLLFKKAINLSVNNGKLSRGQFYTTNDGKMLIGFEDPWTPDTKRYITFYEFNSERWEQKNPILKLRIQDIYSYKSGRSFASGYVPFSRTTLMDVSNNGLIYTAYTESFLIKAYDKTGKYVWGFYYPYKNAVANREVFLNRFSGFLKEAFSKLHTHQFYPALKTMVIDDHNRLWVATIVKNENVYQWWVLDEKGNLLARFTWPRTKPIKVVKNSSIYTIETSKKTGLKHVVRYNIHMQ